jgi:uncharacterized membrane protein YgcG
MTRPKRFLPAAVALACLCALAAPFATFAQVPPASAAPAAAAVPSAADLEALVGPFALYPDDLVAIIVPASTFPLQIVQADRFLEKRKADPNLKIDEGWDDSVKALVNYPAVIKKMSSDLEWTEALGNAVVASTPDVMAAIQAFRRKAQSAGNLKSDAKQVVGSEQEVITIVPADPTVIYVPQYVPSQVVVTGAPVYAYSPPYPVYYYPYAPGAALATGIIWGAAMGAIWSGGRYASHYGGNNNITINRGDNNFNSGNVNRGDRGGGDRTGAGGDRSGAGGDRSGGGRSGAQGGSSSTWKPSSSQRTGQAGSSANRPSQGQRVGDAPGGGASASNRAAGAGAGRDQGGAFGGVDSGAAANRASTRGQESRGGGASASTQPRGGGAGSAPRASTGGGGGGARASGGGGGGGARGGGGGGGGGRGGGGGGGRGGGGRR